MSRFDDKVVLITGAAGDIGRASAERFASEGASVVAVDLEGAALEDTVNAVEKAGAQALGVAADVTVAADVERAVAEARARFGGLDALFNNAGIEGVVAPIDRYPDDAFDRVLAVNVRGVFLLMKHTVPLLRERGGGAIVNTASVLGVIGDANIPAYVASKHAVIGLTKSAAITYGPDLIRVNAVCPSPIETRMMRALETAVDPGNEAELKKQQEALIPLGRYGTPDEVASLVTFLCSDDARFINGSMYTIDGGMTNY